MACGSEVMALWEIGLEKKARRLLKNAQQQKQIMSLFLLMEIRRKEKGLYDRCLRVARAMAIFHKRFERLPK